MMMYAMYKKRIISFLSIPHITSMTMRELSTVEDIFSVQNNFLKV